MKREAPHTIVISPEELRALLVETAIQIQQAQRGTMTTRELCAWLKISRSSWTRMLAEDASLAELGADLDGARVRWRPDQVWQHLLKRGRR